MIVFSGLVLCSIFYLNPYIEFYIEEYSTQPVKITAPEWVRVDMAGNRIRLEALKKNAGIITLNDKSFLVIGGKDEVEEVFIYKGTATRVFIAGSFNGWNPGKDLMEYKDGVFIKKLFLKPGVYEYKFVADGKWIYDPLKPTVPDGFGGFNNLIEIKASKPYIKGKKLEINENSIYIEIETSADRVYALRNFEVIFATKTGNICTISFSRTQFDDIKIIGVKDGNVTDLIEFPVYKTGFDVRDSIIYMLFIDRFYNADRSNDFKTGERNLLKWAEWQGGDFKGLKNKILEGYFEKLGVDVLWLNPVYDNPDNAIGDRTYFHGYAPITSTQVENHYGSMEDFMEVIKAMNERGLKLMLDMVYNHTHILHPLYQKHREWYSPLTLPDGRKNIKLFDERPLDTSFGEDVPNIDYSKNPDAIKFQIENTVYWLQLTGAYFIRIDALKHLEDEFLSSLSKALRVYSLEKNIKVYTIGETISDRETISRYIEKGFVDTQFDFPLYWAIRGVFAWNRSFRWLEMEVRKSLEYPVKAKIIGNHDFPRFVSYAEDLFEGMNHEELTFKRNLSVKNPLTYEKLKMAFAFLMSLNGIPVIYYGDETGLPGGVDPDNRRMMKFKLSRKEASVFDFVRNAVDLRKKHMALRYGSYKTLYVDDDTYIYEKEFFGEKLIFLFTRKELRNTYGTPVFSNKKFTSTIPPYTVAVFSSI